jgi:RNA polymerase sigma-70 factor (ECF subfamily)
MAALEHVAWTAQLETTPEAGKSDIDREADMLVLRWQRGDASAFGELYGIYFDSVYAYAHLMLRNRHQAEDVAQDVFAKVLRGLSAYEVRPTMPFRAWLFRIARNRVIDVIRLADRLHFREPAVIEGLQDELAEAAVLDWIDDSDLTILMRRLPAAQRDVLYMRFVLDMATEQIAEIMDRSPKAIRHLQVRALQSLERWLDGMGSRSLRRQRLPSLLRIRPAPVMAARRFALGYPTAGANRWG